MLGAPAAHPSGATRSVRGDGKTNSLTRAKPLLRPTLGLSTRPMGQEVSDAALEVRGLRVLVGGVPAVHGIDFTLAQGGRTGLIGESGSGKTLTALAVMGLLPEGLTATGRALYGGED